MWCRITSYNVCYTKLLRISQKKQYNIFLKTFNLLNYHYYKKTGDFEQALKYHENYQELEKEEFIKKWNSQLIEAERKYESDKKDSEIAIKELSLKNQSNELKNSKIKLVRITSYNVCYTKLLRVPHLN